MKKFTKTERAKWVYDGATTIVEMIQKLEDRIVYLKELQASEVTLEDPVDDDWATLTTLDPTVAEKYGFEKEDEDEDYEESASDDEQLRNR